ncbi:MAG: hypothetical protein GXY38_04865 [Planctomycetes bacterium]|nr:hypothetical protein [Planctomycetota bacterium]
MICEDVAQPLRSLLIKHRLDSLDGALAFEAGSDLDKPGLGHRRRTKAQFTDDDGGTHVFFIKRYGKERLRDRLKRRLEGGKASGPAGIEYANIVAANKLGVTRMRAVAWGQSRDAGYLVVSAVAGEALSRQDDEFWRKQNQDAAAASVLGGELASLAWRLHEGGYCHRDMYACHIFLCGPSESGNDLSLIDLARMFRPRWRKRRWRVKDLAELHSSLPTEWLARYWDGFLDRYTALSADDKTKLGRAVERKSAGIRAQLLRRCRRRQS